MANFNMMMMMYEEYMKKGKESLDFVVNDGVTDWYRMFLLHNCWRTEKL